MFVLNNWPYGPHRAPQPGDFATEEYAGPALRRNRAIYGAEGEIRQHFAGNDALQRVRTAYAAKCEVGEQYLRSIADRHNGGTVERISNSHAFEGMM